ncbi:MAG: M23 family metallopeptidase, partial [Candidatus Thioglobus sp.]|nr:M23 family metallopeptidase [Candidatus Thioglobus sp.]
TSPFGLKRFYNGEARRPHTGLDFAGDVGTPIKAPADGKIILTGDFFFNGNGVFIDHGQGLVSVYIHMNKRLVEPGQLVKQGDIIGTIGQTGRTTGPHLHWVVYLNQTAVNPNLLLGNK